MDEKKIQHSEGEKSMSQQGRRWWGSMFTEGESESGESKSLKDVVKSMNIDGQWFFRQIPLLLLILGGILLMVTNRYQAQQEIIEKEQLQTDVEDWRFRALTRSSELTTRTRQSQIEERLKQLGDSLLTPAKEPPFTINPND
ncbi:MAG: hypothetical protein IJ197_10490 [Bacteroidaceae bacterium]|nr:hypothetical protein [Bacteroidaceae bacterium]